MRNTLVIGLIALLGSVACGSSGDDDDAASGGTGGTSTGGTSTGGTSTGGTSTGGTSSDGGSAGATGGASSGGTDATGGSAGASNGTWGATCATEVDCTGETNYCAVRPGDANGYCTATGCTPPTDTTICPDGWACMDLSVFAPDLPTMCAQP